MSARRGIARGSRRVSAFVALIAAQATVTALSSPSAGRWSGAQVRTVTGTGFTVASQAQVDGANVTTAYVSPTQLTVTIPRTALWELGTRVVSVVGATGSANFTVFYDTATVYRHWRPDSGRSMNGATVQVWTDGVTGEAATQLTAAAQPTYVASHASYNNRPVLSFDGGDYLVTAAFSAAIVQPFMMCFVGECSDATANRWFLGDSQTTANNVMRQFVTSGQVGISSNSGTFAMGNAARPTTSKRLVGGAHISGASKVYVDSLTAGTTASAGTASLAGISIGARKDGSGPITGIMGEVAIFNESIWGEYAAYAAAYYAVTLV